MTKNYYSFTTDRIFGIPIKFHIPSTLVFFFLFLPFCAYLFGIFYFEGSEHQWLGGLLFLLLTAFSTLPSEIAYLSVAMKNGIRIKTINFPIGFGRAIRRSDIEDNPKIELKITIARTLMLILTGALILIAYIFFMTFEGDWVKFLRLLGSLELGLGIFGLIFGIIKAYF